MLNNKVEGLICPNYRIFLDNSKDIIFIIDKKYHIITFNPAYQNEFFSLTDYQAKEGDAVYSKHFPLGLFNIEKNIFNKALDGESFDFRTQVLLKGKEKAYSHRLCPFYNADRVIAGVTVITRLITTEPEISLEQNRFKSILDNMKDGIYIVDKDANIEYVNPVIEKEFGAVQGQKCYEYFHGNHSRCEWCKNEEVYSGKTVEWEWYSKKNDKWYNLVDMPFRNDDGSISKFEIFHDITDRKRVELALQESEERFRLAFDNANIGMCLVNLEGRLFQVNRKMTEMFGYSKEELEKMSVNDFSYPEDVDLSPNFIREAIKGEKDEILFEKRYINKNGNLVWCKVSSALVKDVKGNALYFISALQDITLLKETEQLISIKDELIHKTGEMSKVGGWEIDAVTFKGKWTEVVALIHDLDPAAEINAEAGIKYYIEEHRDIIRNAVNDAINHAKPYDLELEIITAKNVHKWIRTTGNPVIEKGKVVKVRGIFQDITERKLIEIERENLITQLEKALENERSSHEEMEAAYEEMEVAQWELESNNKKLEKALDDANESNRLKQELLALMSHEIRTPLSGITGFTELTLNEIAKNQCSERCKEHQTNLSYIYKSALRLNDLLTNLLELSSLLAGKQIEIRNQYFDIDEMISDILVLFEKRISGHNNEIVKEIHCNKKIYSDPLRIQQILFNLIGNALKFTENGNILISVDRVDNRIIFLVKDSGIGIDKTNHEIIFDTFKQIDSAVNTRKYQGVGIGLSVCKKFVEALNGKIWLESRLGSGSSFYFSIPIQGETGMKNNRNSSSLNIEMKAELKVLYAEDDEVCFQFLNQLIHSFNPVKCKGFLNGSKLIEEYKADNDYNVILLDIQMPGLNGVDCLKEIRKLNSNVPVIAITAYSMNEDRGKFLALGFNEYISKPVDKNILLLKIKGLLE